MTAEKRTGAAPGPALRVLVAEDHAINEMLVRAILEKEGCAVQVVRNGRAVPALARSEHFDVVLMDVQMPGMDGLAATAAIRKTEGETGGHIPIVGVTAQSSHGGREACLAAGMDAFVSKPIRPPALFAAIDEAIRRAAQAAAAPPDLEARLALAAILDETALLGLVDEDADLLAELAGLFLEDGPRRLLEIRGALDAGDPESLLRAAHQLKGSAGSVCGRRTAAAALRLEEIAEKADLGEARRIYPILERELGKLQEALARLAART
ncbi:MAG TPA: response regulator [Myxococcales bacterium]|nr:response regulator [Myxococcales bacterium]